MIIDTVSLINFRSHEVYKLKCQKKTSLIVGENGSGKTSVLEAIYLALRGKSFRAGDAEILRRGDEYYRVELLYKDGEKVVVTYDGIKRSFLVGDKKYGRLPKKYRYPVVLFLPSDLHLVESSPTRRRDYFDRSISELNDGYSGALSKYNKALKQRNELLKNELVREGELFSWNVMLAKYGLMVRKEREKFVKLCNERLTKIYHSIAENDDEVGLKYILQGDKVDESGYMERLTREFERDKILGHTGFGVHRDGYEFMFNKCIAEGSASRGEIRSMMLALKFIEAELITEWTGRRPVVLLDDVFSELDETRQKCLVKNFKDNQVIITSVDYSK